MSYKSSPDNQLAPHLILICSVSLVERQTDLHCNFMQGRYSHQYGSAQ